MTDLGHLPIHSAVLEVRAEPDESRHRVTFKRLAAIYYLRDDEPQQAAILAALQASVGDGRAVELTYDLTTKCIRGVGGTSARR